MTTSVLLAIFGAGRHHGGRPAVIILVVLVLALGIYLFVRWRRRKDAPGMRVTAPWKVHPPAQLPIHGEPVGPGEPLGDPLLETPPPPPPPPPIPPPPPTPRLPVPPAPNVSLSRIGPLLDTTSGWAVETHGLSKRFGQNVAVDSVELLVPRGCAFGYLGPNGAGKTTLMRTLLGLTRADGGTMALLGIPVPAERTRALARVGAIIDEPRFHGHLTGRQNLSILAAARGAGADARIGPALDRVGLRERADHRVSSYSMGMRQRLGVACCLLGDPELLVLDEPMNGLDPAGMHEMREMIRSLVDEGRTVMLSSHLLDEVERTCDAVAIVDHGRVVRQGPIEDLVRGSGVVVRVDCSDPVSAARLIAAAQFGSPSVHDDGTVSVTLPPDATRDVVAEINRRLVEAGLAVYGIGEVRTTLEDWFLSVTTRLGDPQ